MNIKKVTSVHAHINMMVYWKKNCYETHQGIGYRVDLINLKSRMYTKSATNWGDGVWPWRQR